MSVKLSVREFLSDELGQDLGEYDSGPRIFGSGGNCHITHT
jgi:hypothetical protein